MPYHTSEGEAQVTDTQHSAAEARAAAMAVLKLAEERDKQRPVPHFPSPEASPPPSRPYLSSPSTNISLKDHKKEVDAVSSSPFQYFKEHMHKIDHKIYLTEQQVQQQYLKSKERLQTKQKEFEIKQKEELQTLRERVKKTSAGLADMFSPSKKKEIPATTRQQSPTKLIGKTKSNHHESTINAFWDKARASFHSIKATKPIIKTQAKPKSKRKLVNEKIQNDLALVHEQCTLCTSLLRNRDTDDRTLLKVVGFLEACLGRMEELTTAKSKGFLLEETSQLCLATYHRLILTLEQYDDAETQKKASEKQPLFVKDEFGEDEYGFSDSEFGEDDNNDTY
jgi:hypothetical protein